MEIQFGDKVEDKNGKLLGTVSNVIKDSWTGDISKFSVKTDLADSDLFYSPADVSQTSDNKVKLKAGFGEVNLSIQFGARVLDKNNQFIGTIDYPVSDPLTGDVKKFKVKTESGEGPLLLSVEDVDKVAPNEVRLKVPLTK